MTKKATNELLELIHGLIAEDMLQRLRDGSCEAKDWAVIVKFLKDNGIDALNVDADSTDAAFSRLVAAAQASAQSSNAH